jgi:hypothetical protein
MFPIKEPPSPTQKNSLFKFLFPPSVHGLAQVVEGWVVLVLISLIEKGCLKCFSKHVVTTNLG